MCKRLCLERVGRPVMLRPWLRGCGREVEFGKSGQNLAPNFAARIVELTNFAPELLRRFGLPATID